MSYILKYCVRDRKMEGVLACFESENFFAFVHCRVHMYAYRNVPMRKKKKKRKEIQLFLVLTKWQYHIQCEIKIFYSSQMKENISVTTNELFPSAGLREGKGK